MGDDHITHGLKNIFRWFSKGGIGEDANFLPNIKLKTLASVWVVLSKNKQAEKKKIKVSFFERQR